MLPLPPAILTSCKKRITFRGFKCESLRCSESAAQQHGANFGQKHNSKDWLQLNVKYTEHKAHERAMTLFRVLDFGEARSIYPNSQNIHFIFFLPSKWHRPDLTHPCTYASLLQAGISLGTCCIHSSEKNAQKTQRRQLMIRVACSTVSMSFCLFGTLGICS